MEEFKKGQNDFKIWGDGIIFGSKNWIIKKLCDKLTEIDASNLSIMKTFRNSGNQKSDLTNFTATIHAVLKNGMMAGYYIGKIDENLYGLFGYKINFYETEIIDDQVLGYGENKQPKIAETISDTNEEKIKTEKIITIQDKEVESLAKPRSLNQSHTEVGLSKIPQKPRSIDIVGEVIPNILFLFVVFLFYYFKWNRVAFLMICGFIIYCIIHYSNRFRNRNRL